MPTMNLENPTERFQLAQRLREDIDAYAAEKFDEGHRTHLGASIIGRECSRYLWYVFNWAFHRKFDGRMQRLFQRGHREEPWLWSLLEGIGCKVKALEPDGKQMRIRDESGHFGGSLDGEVTLPESYGFADAVFLAECKTQNSAKFMNMKDNGVRVEKPDHYAQMMVYGAARGMRYALYFATNKADDDMHIEVVPVDAAFALSMQQKAHRVIWLREPPQKLSTTAVHPTCKYCDAVEICQKGAPYTVNCRSCKNSQAAPAGEWGCHFYGALIPKDVIPKGCDNYAEKR